MSADNIPTARQAGLISIANGKMDAITGLENANFVKM